METAEVSATVCVAEHLQPWGSLEYRAHAEFGAFVSWLCRGRGTSTHVLQDAKTPLQPDPDLQLLSSQAGSTGNSVLTRFLLFLPKKKEMTTSSLFPSHWVLQSVKQPQSPGRRVCAKATWALWFVHHIPWERGRSILLLYSVQGCSPSAQPFW